MTRVKTPDGKRILLALKVSEGTAAAVDHARGDLRRAQWLEALIGKALAAEGISTAPPDRLPPGIPAAKRAARKVPRKRGGYEAGDMKVPDLPPPPASMTVPATPRHPAGAGVFQEPGGEPVVTAMPPVPAVQRQRCTHPGTRMIGGFCPACDHVIEPGGYWREST